MNNYVEFRYRQPNRVIQTVEETRRAYCKGTYAIEWDAVSSRFGIFRADVLEHNIGNNKRDVMAILRAAYNGLSLKSFDEALAFCKAVGIHVVSYRAGKPEYLA